MLSLVGDVRRRTPSTGRSVLLTASDGAKPPSGYRAAGTADGERARRGGRRRAAGRSTCPGGCRSGVASVRRGRPRLQRARARPDLPAAQDPGARYRARRGGQRQHAGADRRELLRHRVRPSRDGVPIEQLEDDLAREVDRLRSGHPPSGRAPGEGPVRAACCTSWSGWTREPTRWVSTPPMHDDPNMIKPGSQRSTR